MKIVFSEINDQTGLISLDSVKKKLSKNTKVIIPVNLYGGVVDNKKIKQIIGKRKIYIIEDSAQAHGGQDNNGNAIGKYSDFSCYSFFKTNWIIQIPC